MRIIYENLNDATVSWPIIIAGGWWGSSIVFIIRWPSDPRPPQYVSMAIIAGKRHH